MVIKFYLGCGGRRKARRSCDLALLNIKRM
jgi:hypothetical protein